MPLGLTQIGPAARLQVPLRRINSIVRGKRGVTPATAWLLAPAPRTSPEFWLNLQAAHDLAAARPEKTIRPVRRVG